jgi:hypothetical protein
MRERVRRTELKGMCSGMKERERDSAGPGNERENLTFDTLSLYRHVLKKLETQITDKNFLRLQFIFDLLRNQETQHIQ